MVKITSLLVSVKVMATVIMIFESTDIFLVCDGEDWQAENSASLFVPHYINILAMWPLLGKSLPLISWGLSGMCKGWDHCMPVIPQTLVKESDRTAVLAISEVEGRHRKA